MSEDLSYILNHLGEDRKKYFNAVTPPIIQSSNFAFDSFKDFKEAVEHGSSRHIYTRGNNPTVEILRKKIAALEKTEDCLAFSSGSGAISSTILTFLEAGDHVICVNDPYNWTKALITEVLPRYGINYDFVDGRDVATIKKALRPNTKMLILESPNSATFALQDLKACADLAKENSIISAIDNSYCSPIFQNPADFGLDLVMHSGTKYLNGHSDVVCGFVCGSSKHIDAIFHFATMTLGNILQASEAAMVLRGLRTLELRVKKSHDTCMKVVEFLKNHKQVDAVFYPWDEDFPQYELALRQMTGSGGLFSILISTKDRGEIEQFCRALKAFLFAVSWGGHESLILPYCSVVDFEDQPGRGLPINLIRFYIGLEGADYLIKDLTNAFLVIA